jgi:putative transposase
MNRKFIFTPGQTYHLSNWGVDQREIFSDVYDYHRFVRLLYLCNSDRALNFNRLATFNLKHLFQASRGQKLVAIKAYCLMPDHFHLIVTEASPKGVSKFMSRLATGYSMYYNYKYGRRGNLYEGPFRAKPINSLAILREMINYIHSQPLKLVNKNQEEYLGTEATADYLRNYTFSSLVDYLGIDRLQKTILDLGKTKIGGRESQRLLLELVKDRV